ncbi:MAG: hypothetical protein IJC76_05140 [Lachnospiraceae bacterium]|nr:hypothetical protein [Lachnospiraceae bacterium]
MAGSVYGALGQNFGSVSDEHYDKEYEDMDLLLIIQSDFFCMKKSRNDYSFLIR